MAGELIKITGIEEVCAYLDRAPKDIVKRAFAKALTAAAVPIVEQFAARTPSRNNLFDPESFREIAGSAEEGTLKDSLVSDIAIDSQGRGGSLSVGFGKNGHIANFVEYGHRMIGHKPAKKDLGQVQPHPFMRPAADAAADDAIEAFAQSIEDSMRSDIES